MKCNYPGAYKHNKMSAKERKEVEAKLSSALIAHIFFGVPINRKRSETGHYRE